MDIINTVVNKADNQLEVTMRFEQDSMGESMSLSLMQSVEVHRSRGVDKRKSVFSKNFKVHKAGEITEYISLNDISAYHYNGSGISMTTELELCKASSLLSYFTKNTKPVQLGFFQVPANISTAKVMLDPPDTFDLFKNFKVISAENQLYFIGVCILSAFAIVGNTLLGWHDQTSHVGQTIFYSHYNSDGEKQSPFLNALVINGAMAVLSWLWLKSILRTYMTFRIVKKLGEVSKGKHYFLKRLLSGESKIDLVNCELRVVACNVEHGQYVTGSGKKRRTNSFKTPVKCVPIYKKQLDHIPKETEIADYLYDHICFDDVYEQLAPNCMITSTHGLKLHWEIQLLHPELVDQEIVGSSDGFFFGHFRLEK